METQINQEAPMQSHKSGMATMSIGLLLVGLIAGYFIGKSMSSDKIVVQTATPTVDSDWQTYRNKKYGFEFQYSDMELQAPPREYNEILYVDNIAYLAPLNGFEGISIYALEGKATCTGPITKISINDIAWDQCVFSADGPELTVYARRLSGGQREMEVVIQAHAATLERYPILSTFKFTN